MVVKSKFEVVPVMLEDEAEDSLLVADSEIVVVSEEDAVGDVIPEVEVVGEDSEVLAVVSVTPPLTVA